jgi:hypothetical protein
MVTYIFMHEQESVRDYVGWLVCLSVVPYIVLPQESSRCVGVSLLLFDHELMRINQLHPIHL